MALGRRDKKMPSGEAGPASPEALDAVWELLDDDCYEEALTAALALTREHPADGEAHLALGGATCEAGLFKAAEHELLEAGQLGVEDEGLRRWYLGETLFQRWRFEEARQLIEPWLATETEDAWGWHLLGRIREFLGDEVGAEAAFVKAARLDPEQFFLPHRITEPEVERALHQARDRLPPDFRDALDALPVQVRPLPSIQMTEDDPDEGLRPDLLGLFTGTSLLDRSVFNPLEQPGVIFLFQKNLERVSPDRECLIEEIRITIWHELAHFLGFDEEAMPGLGLE
jgi:predicted Zn-dependent protease with MMP-like domain